MNPCFELSWTVYGQNMSHYRMIFFSTKCNLSKTKEELSAFPQYSFFTEYLKYIV